MIARALSLVALLRLLLGAALAGAAGARRAADRVGVEPPRHRDAELFRRGAGAVRLGRKGRHHAGQPHRYDLVVTVAGPRADMVTRRKERKFGIWINTDSRQFLQVPTYLALFSNRPFDAIASPEVQRRQQLGLNNVLLTQRVGPDYADVVPNDAFRSAFVRLRTRTRPLSRGDLGGDVPDADAVPHRHSAAGRGADRHLRRRDQAVLRRRAGDARPRPRSKSSRSASSSSSPPRARQNGFVYGLVTALMALMTGWMASIVFRQGLRLLFEQTSARRCRRSIRGSARQRRRRPVVAEHMRHEARRPEYFRERRVADAQAAGIGAERRHHRALAVAGKTAPLHRAAARRHPRLGMQMAGDFARPRRSARDGTRSGRSRLRSRPRRRDRTAAPDRDCPKSRSSRAAPAAPRSRRGRRGQPLMGVAVMKTVAERDHHARVVPRDHGGEPAERRRRIVGRQQHAARGKAGAFFQMQVGDDEQALLFPEQRAGEIGDEASHRRHRSLPKRACWHDRRPRDCARCRHVIPAIPSPL